MRKVYVKPEMEMSFFENLDVITTSGDTTYSDSEEVSLGDEDTTVDSPAAPDVTAAISNDASVEGDGSENDGSDEVSGETSNSVAEEDDLENQN